MSLPEEATLSDVSNDAFGVAHVKIDQPRQKKAEGRGEVRGSDRAAAPPPTPTSKLNIAGGYCQHVRLHTICQRPVLDLRCRRIAERMKACRAPGRAGAVIADCEFAASADAAALAATSRANSRVTLT